MQPQNTLFICLFGLSLMMSCQKTNKEDNTQQLILGNWLLTNNHVNAQKKENEDRLLKDARDNQIVQTGLILSFFPDSTFTQISGDGNYHSGIWKYSRDKKTITFIEADGQTSATVAITDPKKSRQLELAFSQKSQTFTESASPLLDYKDEPFHPTNNLWRIKAKQSENTDDLQARLGNYFKHMALLLKAGTERTQKSINFAYSQGIVKIYRGGIGIQPVDKVPQCWTDAFFMPQEAFMAYEMYDNYLKHKAFQSRNTGNWYIDDYNLLSILYADIIDKKFLPIPAR